jgi:hypothetical protein
MVEMEHVIDRVHQWVVARTGHHLSMNTTANAAHHALIALVVEMTIVVEVHHETTTMTAPVTDDPHLVLALRLMAMMLALAIPRILTMHAAHHVGEHHLMMLTPT